MPKLIKKKADTTEFLVDFTTFLPDGDPIATVDEVDSSVTISGESVLAVSTVIGYDQQKNLFTRLESTVPITIAEGCGVLFTASGGTNFTENTITITVTTVGGIEIVVNVFLIVADLTYDSVGGKYTNPLQYYGSVNLANEYFALAEDWECLDEKVQMGSLIRATRAIDRLNFLGFKTDPDQILQFPRTDWTLTPNPNLDYLIPDEICWAAYEEALLLAKGNDGASGDFGIIAEGLGTAKVSYNRDFIQERFLSNVNSAMAWNYLKPYLRDNREIHLSRVN